MEENFSSQCGPRLNEERKALGLKQVEMAEKCGVSREVWGRYERGLAAPGGDVLMRLANLGADVLYVLTGSRDGPPRPAPLKADEQLVLDRYQAAPQALKDAALRVLLGDDSRPNARQEQVFKGDVGQAVKVEGNLDQRNVKFTMGKKGK